MMVEISGPLVQELERQFKKAWADSGILGGFAALLFPGDQEKSEISESAGKSVRLLFTKPTKAEIYQAQLGAIRRSRGYIFLENAYFADDRILYELCAARKRGVDARVILTLKADSGLMNRNNVVVINTLLRHGVRVFLHPRMTHIKAAVFDGWACFGSANFDKLSLKINRELNLATSDPGVVQTLLDRLFYKDMDESIELVEPVPESWVDKFVEVIADEL